MYRDLQAPGLRVRDVLKMSLLDFEKFAAVPLQHEPCPYLVVPRFVKPEALERINADYPCIDKPGNFLSDVRWRASGITYVAARPVAP